MVYNYLLDLYKVLAKRKEEIKLEWDKSSGDHAQRQYQQGRLTAITDFTLFLQQNYHDKLPRRLQKTTENTPVLLPRQETKERKGNGADMK